MISDASDAESAIDDLSCQFISNDIAVSPENACVQRSVNSGALDTHDTGPCAAGNDTDSSTCSVEDLSIQLAVHPPDPVSGTDTAASPAITAVGVSDELTSSGAGASLSTRAGRVPGRPPTRTDAHNKARRAKRAARREAIASSKLESEESPRPACHPQPCHVGDPARVRQRQTCVETRLEQRSRLQNVQCVPSRAKSRVLKLRLRRPFGRAVGKRLIQSWHSRASMKSVIE